MKILRNLFVSLLFIGALSALVSCNTGPSGNTAGSGNTAQVSPGQAAAASGKRIAAYFADWSIYSGHNEYLVSDIPFSKLTHIYYAFAGSGPTLVMLDPYGDTQDTFGGAVPYGSTNSGCLGQLMYYKTLYPWIKTIISVGGWNDSDGFHAMAETAAGRQAFAASAVAWIRCMEHGRR